MREMQTLLMELDRLKSVYRRAYLSDHSRNENSAEHSWHLAVALLALKAEMPSSIDIDHAVRLALAHDICEIGAGDVSVYDAERSKKTVAEQAYMTKLAAEHGGLADEFNDLWCEFEAQQTPVSRWVKAIDRLLPILMNLATEGRAWKEQGIARSQVLEVNQVIAEESPEIFQWLVGEIDSAVASGWLIDT